jgi:hypothetical protein
MKSFEFTRCSLQQEPILPKCTNCHTSINWGEEFYRTNKDEAYDFYTSINFDDALVLSKAECIYCINCFESIMENRTP